MLKRPSSYFHCNNIKGAVDQSQRGLCSKSYCGESISHLDIRSGEYMGVSPATGKKIKPSNNSDVCDYLLHCNILPFFDNCILAHENKMYLLEFKKKFANHERQTICKKEY